MADFFDEMGESFLKMVEPFWPGAGETEKAKEFSRWNHVFPNVSFSPLEIYAALEETLRKKKLPGTAMGRVTWKERGLFSVRREYLRVERDRYVYDICAAPFGEDFFFSSWLVILPRSFSRMHILGMLATLFMFIFAGALSDSRNFGGGGIWWMIGAALVFISACVAAKLKFLRRLAPGRIDLEDFLSGMTILGALYDRYWRPLTYFERDTASMFEKSVHGAMMEIIDGLTQAKGIRLLTEDERKPEYFVTPVWVSFYKQ